MKEEFLNLILDFEVCGCWGKVLWICDLYIVLSYEIVNKIEEFLYFVCKNINLGCSGDDDFGF